VTRYDFFRRRVAPVAFAVVLGLMAHDMCNKHERTHSTFVLTYGAAATDVREVEAEIWMNGERVSTYRHVALEGGYIGPTTFETSLPDTSGELRVDVTLPTGVRHAVRRLQLHEGETVTVDLERDLR
jgi:hypothetical protein